MSMNVLECERCLKVLHTYSGEHLCPSCAEILGRSTYSPWWGDFKAHPDAELQKRLRQQVDRELKRTIELNEKRAA
jgi:hypothetical protein